MTTSPSGTSRPASLADALIAFDAAELELARVRRDLYDAERRLGDRAAQCLALQDAHADAAAMLAEVAAERDRGSAARDAALDLYEDGLIDLALDEIAVQEERARQPKRPRTAIERMVDEACGIEVRDDGTIVELRR